MLSCCPRGGQLAAPPPPWTASRSAPPAAVSSPLPTAASSSHAVLPYKKTKNNGGDDWATITIIIVQSYVWTIDPRVHSGGPYKAHPCIPVGKKVGPKGPVGLRKGGVRGGKKKKKALCASVCFLPPPSSSLCPCFCLGGCFFLLLSLPAPPARPSSIFCRPRPPPGEGEGGEGGGIYRVYSPAYVSSHGFMSATCPSCAAQVLQQHSARCGLVSHPGRSSSSALCSLLSSYPGCIRSRYMW